MNIIIGLLLIAQSNLGVVEGIVTDCTNGPEQAVYNATVNADRNDLKVRSDLNGKFTLILPSGTYTIIATDPNGTTSRQYIPVDAGQTIDIGTLDIGGGYAGCFVDTLP